MNEAREYYNKNKNEIFNKYFRTKTMKKEKSQQNIFSSLNKKNNSIDNRMIKEEDEDADNSVDNMNSNVFKTPTQNKCKTHFQPF